MLSHARRSDSCLCFMVYDGNRGNVYTNEEGNAGDPFWSRPDEAESVWATRQDNKHITNHLRPFFKRVYSELLNLYSECESVDFRSAFLQLINNS